MHSITRKIIQLTSISGIGAGYYWKLIDLFKNFEGIFEATYPQLSQIVEPDIARAIATLSKSHQNTDDADRVIEWCESNSVSIINHFDNTYPLLLKEIKRGPPLLYVRGDASALSSPQIAVVGSRSCSQVGRRNAFKLSAELVDLGLSVTSGLALGIDTEAHLGALSANGKTIAVLGTGIDVVYPQRNRFLAEKIIAQGGSIVSEFPIGTKATPQNFPQRNRIISGLALGALVVEAAIKSGSLITARYALEQNRDVFAVPGSIHNPLAKGPHSLIKDGATLVESASDIVDQLTVFTPQADLFKPAESNPLSIESLSDAEQQILALVDNEPTPIDIIAAASKSEIGELIGVLMNLEMECWICQNSAGYARLPR